MKCIEIGSSGVKASNLIMGCMRLKEKTLQEVELLVRTAMEEGINFFDHADIYGRNGHRGECEEIFGKAVNLSDPSIREKILIQSKCGIVKGETTSYDFSKEHILKSVDGILSRLGTEYLDFLLLHRPDSLMEPEEVAEAFDVLYTSGKVRHFGMSNQNAMQLALLQKYIPYKLEIDQLQLSIAHCPMIDSGISANMDIPQSYDRDGSVLEYTRMHDITIQAWSPFQQGFFGGPFLGDTEHYEKLNQVIDRIADKYNVTNTAVAVAWITRHPADIQVILGTTNPQRMKDACQGSDLRLTRAEWYELYQASGKKLP